MAYSTQSIPKLYPVVGIHKILDLPNGLNKLVIEAYSNLSIPKLYPIVGFRKEPPGIALPPLIPLDLPKSIEVKRFHHVDRCLESSQFKGFDVGTVPKVLPTFNVLRPQIMVSGLQQKTLS